MLFLETAKKIIQFLSESYEVISSEADFYCGILINNLDYQIKEIITDETELRRYLLQEIAEARKNIHLPPICIELLKLEDRAYFEELDMSNQEIIFEDYDEKLENQLNRYFSSFLGLPAKELEGIKSGIVLKEEEQNLANFLSKLWACKRYYRVLKSKLKKLNSKKTNIPNIHWQKKNTTEFVQFVYGMIEAGYIDGFEGERTKIVEEVALQFNYSLPKNWNTNLSVSINNRNADYEPKIFDNIKKGYVQYSDRMLNKKK